jgi:hypothetical protein
MSAFPLRSQRRAAGPAGLAVVGALVPAILAACSLMTPATFAPAQSLAAATDAPTATPALTPGPTATPLVQPSMTPAPSLAPVAQWHTLGHALAAPAAWLDFGFAANGDVLAIGTRDATADPLHLFVARITPAGRLRGEHRLSRSVTPIEGDWSSIDPTDDSIIIDDYSRSKFSFSLRRFSSATGYNVANALTDGGVDRLAIDGRGRQFGLPQYGVGGNAYAAIVRMDARSRVRAGVDYWLRPLDAGPRPEQPATLAYPTAIACGRDGRVIVVDAPDVDATYPDGTPRRTAVVTSLTSSLASPRQWELPVEWPFGSPAFVTWSHRLTIAGAADGSLYVGEPIVDAGGATVTGWRVRHFDAEGDLLDAWGSGTLGIGLVGPNHPNVDAGGRLWVIDTDPATGTSVIAALSLPA